MSETKTHRERELKFEVPPGFTVPDVAEVLPGIEVLQHTVSLSSTYHDTVGLDLLAQRITLRRRTGDTDTGWQLKIPAGDARDELSAPLGENAGADDEVPAALSDLVAGIARAGDLVPVATLSTQRHITRVQRAGELVVEIADDHVSAAAGGSEALVWRELEIELGPAGTEDDLAAFARRVRRAGATASPSGSKLARALGREPHEVSRSPAGQLVADYLSSAHRTLIAGDIALRRGQPDVHKTRVAARRIRSVLRVFRDVLGRDAGGTSGRALDAELSWYQGLLGEVHDRQVQRERFAAALAELPAELILGPVAERIKRTLLGEETEALAAVTAAPATNRYRRLLAAVAALVAADPVLPGISRSRLRAISQATAGTAAKRLRSARRADGDAEHLHRARKAVKRARYAAELVGRSGSAIKKYKQLQDVLGDHHDAVVAADVLRRMGTAAGASAGENGFTFGLLHERELQLAERLQTEVTRLRVPRAGAAH